MLIKLTTWLFSLTLKEKPMKSFLTACAALLISSFLESQTLFSWATKAGGPDIDGGNAIAVDPAGNVYTTGSFRGTADFDPGAGTFNLTAEGLQDMFILKVDASGNFQWAKQIAGTGSYKSGTSIIVDAAGNVYTTGIFMGTADFDPGPATYNLTSAGGWDTFVSKLDASGNFVWTNWFGGIETDWGYALTFDPSGNIYAAGSFMKTIDFDPGPGTVNIAAAYVDVFIVKLNPSGNYMWATKMGGGFTDEARAIAVDAAGNIYTTGNFLGFADFDPGAGEYWLNSNVIGGSDADVFISKLDASGNFVWAKQLAGWYPYECFSFGIGVDVSGNVYTTGRFHTTVDFDPGPGTAFLISDANDGFLLKLNSSGDYVWAKKIGGCAIDDFTSGLVLDASGNVYVSGHFQFVGDFDPGAGTYNMTGFGNTDGYVCEIDPSGNFVRAFQLGGTDFDYATAIALDASGNIYTTGQFRGNSDFDPTSGTFTLSSSGSSDIFMSKVATGSPLPVKFTNVKAYQQNTGIRIDWSNLIESNVLDYKIERSSDARAFLSIGATQATKNNGDRADYSYLDPSPLTGVNFYRIQSLETDGKKEYSAIVKVNMIDKKTRVDIYPNPVVNGELALQTIAFPKGSYSLKILNANGQLVFKQQLYLNGGSATEIIHLPGSLKTGVYYLKLANPDLELGKKILIK